MEKFVIEGGVPLSGTITAAGNKNGALPILAACLLTDEPVQIENVPRIRDVEAMLEILAALGVESPGVRTTKSNCAPRRSRRLRSMQRLPSRSVLLSCSRARCLRALAVPSCRRRAAT